MTTEIKIAALLKEAIGFDVATVGRSVIDHALRARMAACGTGKLEDYWQKLQRCKVEMQELIESVVVPETWFFREREAFTALIRIILDEWLPDHSTGMLRLLSVPCSSGEEPYSMAMALLDADLAPKNFIIEAADISRRALALAEHAVYAKNSFRGRDLDFRDRYFQLTDGRYQLAQSVQSQVRFEQRNLLADDFLAGAESYDVIFCRNVLIYFDAPTQQRVINTLNRLLAPKGILFVGPSEAFALRNNGFVSANHPRAFAYRQATAPVRSPLNRHEEPRQKARATTPRPAPKPSARKQLDRTQAPVPAKPKPDLKIASRLADAGDLVEAARECETYLREQGACAAGYYLLGIVRDAMGDRERAADCYRKTIYLQSDHSEALTHLSLLAEKRGDVSTARRLQQRARRVEEMAAG
jgi:chemotaxis protein methyltransferase WspC